MIKQEKYIYFSIYFLFSSVLIFSGNTTFGGVWDDYQIWNMIKEGDPRTLILSYPMSIFLKKLYTMFPSFQWFSLTFLIAMSFNMYVASYTIEKIKDKKIKIYLFILYSILFFYFWFNASITLLSGYTFFFIIPMLFYSYTSFIIGLFTISLLRNETIIIYLPLIILIWFMFKNHMSKPTKREIILGILAAIWISFTFLSVKFDSQYEKWLTFNKARAYFLDSKTNLEGLKATLDGKITEDERLLLTAWWVQDNELLSSEKIINASGGIQDKFDASRFYYQDIFLNKYNSLIIFALIMSLCLLFFLFLNKLYKMILLFTLFIIYIGIIFMIRDVERVTFPILLSWVFIILIYFHCMKNKINVQMFSLVFIGIIFTISMDKYYLYKHHKAFTQNIKKEFERITRSHEKTLEISLSFPYGKSENYIDKIFKNQALFFESDWVLLSNENILLPFGWFARHPLFYKIHNIDFENKNRKFSNYYEFMVDNNTAFIGEKDVSLKIFDKKLLTMYNEKYLSNTNCYLTIVLLDESKHFTISQVQKICNDLNGKENE